jgi:hypothetical protein
MFEGNIFAVYFWLMENNSENFNEKNCVVCPVVQFLCTSDHKLENRIDVFTSLLSRRSYIESRYNNIKL